MKAFSSGVGPVLFLDPGSLMDIGQLLVDDVDIAPGRAIPDDGDPRIDHSLEGFLFTCGPDHIRHPVAIDGAGGGRQYPLHGSFSSHPAEITFWNVQEDAECRARIPVTTATGGTALLDRRWLMDGATGEVSLADRLTNTGDRAFAVFHMYHINIGAWLFDDHVRLNGRMLEAGGLGWNFGADPGSVFCVEAKPGEDGWAEIALGPIASLRGRTLKVRFRTDTLPYLQMWRNQKAPAHVLGIEPVSHRLAGRAELEAGQEVRMLEPGASIDYALRFQFC